MEQSDFDSAKVLQDDILKINGQQTAANTSGAKVVLTVVRADGTTILSSPQDLKAALGDAYDTICATAKASIIAGLTTVKNTKQTAFTDL